MRRLTLALVALATLALVACTTGSADQPELDALLLRLSDVPAGASIGDDSACSSRFSREGGHEALGAWLQSHPVTNACLRQLERERPDGMFERVISIVVEFDTADDARQSLEMGEELLAYFGHDETESFAQEVPVGEADASWILVPPGVHSSGIALTWSHEEYRHFVLVTGIPVSEGLPRALEYAKTQHERATNPTPLTEDDLDDSQAGLADIDDVAVYWVGPEWEPDGGPPAELIESHSKIPRGSSPGNHSELSYASPGGPYGAFDIETWSSDAWQEMLAGRLGPTAIPECATPEVIDLPDRRIELHGMGSAEDCFASASAYVFFEEAVVSIGIPNCIACWPQPGPYREPEYLETIARALVRYGD